ncbi:MAG: GNAT family N-acetyltransferase [Bacteroidota bacterium]
MVHIFLTNKIHVIIEFTDFDSTFALTKNTMMDEILIRKASVQDFDTLFRFEMGIIHAERPFDSTLRKDEIHYYDLEEMITAPNVKIVVAELNNELIGSGYARIEKSKGYLQHKYHACLGFMYVDPQHRGKGVNMKIINVLKEWATSQNITELRLEVYADNLLAVKAYEKAGFRGNMLEMRMGL